MSVRLFSKTEARQFLEENGIPKPQTRLLDLFFEESGTLHQSLVLRVPLQATEHIIRHGNLPQRAVEYYSAKQNHQDTIAENIWKAAHEYITESLMEFRKFSPSQHLSK